MKGYTRNDPGFSLCGLHCALCPMHLGGHCPGCGGGAGHQSCAFIRCSVERGVRDHCTECAAFPCQRYDAAMAYDSFVPHRHRVRDLLRQQKDPAAFGDETARRATILQALLDGYNDGRRKTLFCTAASLLDVQVLERVIKRLRTAPPEQATVKEKAALAAALLQEEADGSGVPLKLNQKPKSPKT